MIEEFKWLDPDLFEPLENMRTRHPVEERLNLFNDIKRNGIQQNVRARPHPNIAGKYQVYAGRLRVSIAQELKHMNVGLSPDDPASAGAFLEPKAIRAWSDYPILVPTIIKEAGDDEAFSITLSENINRSDVTDYEIGNWLQMMKMKFPILSQKDLGDRIGRSQAFVSRHLRLVEEVEKGKIPKEIEDERSARAFRSLSEEEQQKVMKEAVENGIAPSVREMERKMIEKGLVILSRFRPPGDGEFLTVILREEGDLTHEQAQNAISEWRSKGSKMPKEDITPDPVATRLARYYPACIVDKVLTAFPDSVFDLAVLRCSGLIRELWKMASEETKEEAMRKLL